MVQDPLLNPEVSIPRPELDSSIYILDGETIAPKLLKGELYRGLYMGTTIGDIKGDTRSLDIGSNDFLFWPSFLSLRYNLHASWFQPPEGAPFSSVSAVCYC